jgi:acyl carrier protein
VSSAIAARIRRLVVESLRLEGLEPQSIGDDQPLFGEGLGLDSIVALELVVALEREFGIAIANDDVGREALGSVAAIERLVVSRLRAQEAPAGG